MTIPIKKTLPSIALTIIYCLASSLFIHAQHTYVIDHARFAYNQYNITRIQDNRSDFFPDTGTADDNAPAAPVITVPLSNTIYTDIAMTISGTAEPLSLVTVYLDGSILVTASADDGGNWTALYTLNGITDGNHVLRATATDAARNVSQLSAAVPVVRDISVPGPTAVTILSDNKNNSYARIGDVITVYIAVEDRIAEPQILIADRQVPVVAVGEKEYTGTYTVTAQDIDGNVPFSIRFHGLNGNAGDTITVTTDNSRVYIDKKPPVATINTLDVSPVRKAFVVYISFSEPIADFDLSYLRVTNAAISNLEHISNNVMTILVSPTYDGPVTLGLTAGASHDVAGNPSLESDQFQMEAIFGGYFEKVYPNPASGMMRLQFIGTVNDRAKITMTSFRGVVVYEKELLMDSKALTLDVSSIPAGAYIVTIQSKNYSFYTNVMVVH